MWAKVTVRAGEPTPRASGAVNAIHKAYLMIQAIQELEYAVNTEERPVHLAGVEHPLNYNVGVIRR